MHKVSKASCRLCKLPELVSVFDLGEISLSGTFLNAGEFVPVLPLNLARCLECGLVQLYDDLPVEMLYSSDYGYESHLNSSMVTHLKTKAENLCEILAEDTVDGNLQAPRTILDIASNDGTLLHEFSKLLKNTSIFIGCDPLISNFKDKYPSNAQKIEKFFTSANVGHNLLGKIDLVTSLSVYYDVKDPLNFAQDVWSLLKPGGYWHLEQSYFPLMLRNNSYDTICHEHLLYFSASDLKKIAQKIGFEVVNFQLNEINGGSLELTLRKRKSNLSAIQVSVNVKRFEELCNSERISGITDGVAMASFAQSSQEHALKLRNILLEMKSKGIEIYALGASTKGNIILNYSELTDKLISCIGEVNEKKFGKVTPGTNIPICDENFILKNSGENKVALILPWHFRATFIEKAKFFLETGGKLIFPLPEIEIIEL